MTNFRLAENIIRLRHEKKLTQEDIANFAGVTKASVSKWENSQSLPDITILPVLANLFDVTIDELLGYEAQMEKKQIQKLYKELSELFAVRPFEEVYEKVRHYVKEYYSCYPLVLQMCFLMMNHYKLPKEPKVQEEVLLQIRKWCRHIQENCRVSSIQEDALSVQTMLDLFLGNYEAVISQLKESANPLRLSRSNNIILMQAFLMSQDTQNAEKYAQIYLVNALFEVMALSTLLLMVQMPDKERCSETMHRMDVLMETWQIENLNMNQAIQYYYQAAINQTFYEEKEAAYKYLEKCINTGIALLKKNEQVFEEDAYFDRISEWMKELDMENVLPRDKKLISTDVMQLLEHPVLQQLAGEERFQKIKQHLEREAALCQK